MIYKTPYDTNYYQDKVDCEKKAQILMDVWYENHGGKIINRSGNKERDLILELKDGTYKIEEKYRDKDYGDIIIEVIQDLVGNKPGWFYTEKPDILSYIILDNHKNPQIVYWIKFEKFKNWFYKYLEDKKIVKAVISPLGYGLTLNISVPWNCIQKDIYSRYVIIGN